MIKIKCPHCKNNIEFKRNKILFQILIIAIFFIIVGAFVGRNITLQEDCNYFNELPSQQQIDFICKTNNYQYGWLDNYQCNSREVMCFKELPDKSKRYDCVSTNIIK